MTREEVQKLPFGLYRIKWTESMDSGQSLAAVGQKYDGSRWLCCSDWTSPSNRGTDAYGKIWDSVESVEPIEIYNEPCDYCKAGSKPWLNGNGFWMHEGGVCCQTPEKNCTCHLGSVCTKGCEQGKHHDGCGRINQ